MRNILKEAETHTGRNWEYKVQEAGVQTLFQPPSPPPPPPPPPASSPSSHTHHATLYNNNLYATKQLFGKVPDQIITTVQGLEFQSPGFDLQLYL